MSFPAKWCWSPIRARRFCKPGDCAGFKAGDKDGHHLQNRSNADALLLEVGTRLPNDAGEYPDIDMAFQMGGSAMYTRKDGTPTPISNGADRMTNRLKFYES
jgi:uncharacterized cupin superfamily protein